MVIKLLVFVLAFYVHLNTSLIKNTEKVSFILKNDLALNVAIDVGGATIILRSGSAYKLERSLGDKVYLIRKNEPRKLLFVVQKSHRNKILSISQFF